VVRGETGGGKSTKVTNERNKLAKNVGDGGTRGPRGAEELRQQEVGEREMDDYVSRRWHREE